MVTTVDRKDLSIEHNEVHEVILFLYLLCIPNRSPTFYGNAVLFFNLFLFNIFAVSLKVVRSCIDTHICNSLLFYILYRAPVDTSPATEEVTVFKFIIIILTNIGDS